MFSLSKHPDAVNGGEWFNWRQEQNPTDVWERKIRQIPCNLKKVFAWDIGHPAIEELLLSSTVVFLYRRDIAAQLESWEKACKSGVWLPGSDTRIVCEFPANAQQQIVQADSYFRPKSSLALASEDLFDKWNDSVSAILDAAGWSAFESPGDER